MRSWQWRNLAPDRTDIGSLTAIKTLALIEDGATHSLFLYIVVVFVYECIDVIQLYAESLSTSSHIVSFLYFEVLADLGEHLLAVMLVGVSSSSLCISTSVAEVVNCLLEFIVVDLVAVLAFNGLTKCLHHLDLSLALWFDSLVSYLDSLEHICFAHLFHLTLYHHDVVECSSYNELDVCFLALLEGWVDHELAIHACYANLRDRTLEWDI